jgi:hypothetical protein
MSRFGFYNYSNKEGHERLEKNEQHCCVVQQYGRAASVSVVTTTNSLYK